MNYIDTEKLRGDLMKGVDDAIVKVKAQYGKLNEKAAEVRQKTDEYVRENPEKSLLIAAGVGALAAMLYFKMMRNRMP